MNIALINTQIRMQKTTMFQGIHLALNDIIAF